jgi:hypothetical protein
MPDINDYGKFENFYQPLPEEKKVGWGKREPEAESPPPRPSPFSLGMAKGTAPQEPTEQL